MENDPKSVSEAVVVEKKIGKEALLIAGSVLLGNVIVAGTIMFALGGVPSFDSLGSNDKGSDSAANVPAANPNDINATASFDDDPILGDKKKAKVAIIEFSDYECPFCKQFHADSLDTLVKDYVDTGKVLLSARDFPLPFHDPKATFEAGIAECVRKDKGDKAYFAIGKEIYKNTQANGKGLVEGKLDELIRSAGANPTSVNKCAESQAVKDEIAKDLTAGQAAGISGTPSFVIGKVDKDGNVTGERVVGALPLPEFKKVIDKYLAQ